MLFLQAVFYQLRVWIFALTRPIQSQQNRSTHCLNSIRIRCYWKVMQTKLCLNMYYISSYKKEVPFLCRRTAVTLNEKEVYI